MIIEKLKPWVMLQDNTKIPMAFFGKCESVYYFNDIEERAALKLEVKKSGNVNAVYVDAVIKPSKLPHSDMDYLNPDCAVGLDADSISGIKRIHGGLPLQ